MSAWAERCGLDGVRRGQEYTKGRGDDLTCRGSWLGLIFQPTFNFRPEVCRDVAVHFSEVGICFHKFTVHRDLVPRRVPLM